MIGGADKYLAVCRLCFQSASKEASPRRPLHVKSSDGKQASGAACKNLLSEFDNGAKDLDLFA